MSDSVLFEISSMILKNLLMCAHLGNVQFWSNYWLILKLVQIIPSPAEADEYP